MPVKIAQNIGFLQPFVYNSFNMSNHDGLYSPADKPVTRYISSFWNCLKVSLTAKSTHRANNSTLLSQCELLTVFLQELTFCQYKTSYYLKNLYILTILLKFTNIVLSISNLKNKRNKTHTHTKMTTSQSIGESIERYDSPDIARNFRV